MSYNLPPGCTMRDIDGPFEDNCPICHGDGEIMYDGVPCICPECSGLGVINTRATGPSTRDKE